MKKPSIPSLTLSALAAVFMLTVSLACEDTKLGETEETTGRTTEETSAYIGDGYVAVPLYASDGGESFGQATLTSMDGRTKVAITLASPSGENKNGHPVHIHPGTCENLDPKPKYPLNNIENGMSETVLEVKLETLTTGGYSVNVHETPQELGNYVACGTIPEN